LVRSRHQKENQKKREKPKNTRGTDQEKPTFKKMKLAGGGTETGRSSAERKKRGTKRRKINNVMAGREESVLWGTKKKNKKR